MGLEPALAQLAYHDHALPFRERTREVLGEIARRLTGEEPGARFVRDAGHERLAGLVAHQSASDAEAEERGPAEALVR
jgi:hypothetical protein